MTENIEQIKVQVAERVAAEAAIMPPEPEKSEVTSKLIQWAATDGGIAGAGLLYSMINAGKVVLVSEWNEWLCYQVHFWERDINQQALVLVEQVVEVLFKELRRVDQEIYGLIKSGEQDGAKYLQKLRRDILRLIKQCRTERGRQDVLKFAAAGLRSMRVSASLFDKNPLLMAFANGVVCLITGRLRPGRPDDYILLHSDVEYPGLMTPAPLLEKTLPEMLDRDIPKINYLQRLCGYLLTAIITEAIVVFFIGLGRNGKSLLIEIIKSILGQMAVVIPTEMLLDTGLRSSSAPTPDILLLKGKRAVFASETPANQKISEQKIKLLTGSDTLTACGKYEKHFTEFLPTHKLILSTNHLPRADADDYGFWQRVHVLQFPLSFVDREPQADFERRADKELLKKLKEEAPGIAAWMVRGCILWQRQGLDPPPVVLEAVKHYRRQEDNLADWIDLCLVLDPKAKAGAQSLFDSYRGWFTENISKYPPSPRTFARLIERKFTKRIISGCRKYQGCYLNAEGERCEELIKNK